MSKFLEKKQLQKALDYESYRKLIDELLIEGKTTGEKQSQQLTECASLNVEKIKNIDQTIQVVPEVEPEHRKTYSQKFRRYGRTLQLGSKSCHTAKQTG